MKHRSPKGSVKRRPLEDNPLSAGTPRFREYRYSAFCGAPATHYLTRRFADLEVCIVSLRTVGYNRRLKIQLPKGVHSTDPLLSYGVGQCDLTRIQAVAGVPIFRYPHLWGRGSKMGAVSATRWGNILLPHLQQTPSRFTTPTQKKPLPHRATTALCTRRAGIYGHDTRARSRVYKFLSVF